jgi:hypothetical protein
MEKKKQQVERVIWQQNWSQQVCAHIPFDGSKCLTLTAGVSVIDENNGKYVIELQVLGGRTRYDISNVCYPVFTYGIASLTVCTSNFTLVNGKIKSITLKVDGCIGSTIAGIHIGQCWTLYNQQINFFHMSTVSATDMNGNAIVEGYNDIAHLEVTPFKGFGNINLLQNENVCEPMVIKFTGSADDLIKRATDALKHYGTLNGNAEKGTIEIKKFGMEVDADYTITGSTITVDITKNTSPFSCAEIEDRLKKYITSPALASFQLS